MSGPWSPSELAWHWRFKYCSSRLVCDNVTRRTSDGLGQYYTCIYVNEAIRIQNKFALLIHGASSLLFPLHADLETLSN